MNQATKAADDAPAMAGWAMNQRAPVDQRLAAAQQALNFYIEQADRLNELLDYLIEEQAKTATDDYELAYAKPVYDDVISRLTNILNGHDAEGPEEPA